MSRDPVNQRIATQLARGEAQEGLLSSIDRGGEFGAVAHEEGLERKGSDEYGIRSIEIRVSEATG